MPFKEYYKEIWLEPEQEKGRIEEYRRYINGVEYEVTRVNFKVWVEPEVIDNLVWDQSNHDPITNLILNKLANVITAVNKLVASEKPQKGGIHMETRQDMSRND